MGERRADDVVAELRAEGAAGEAVLNEVNDRNDRQRVFATLCRLYGSAKTKKPLGNDVFSDEGGIAV